jgi:hypothetical protein
MRGRQGALATKTVYPNDAQSLAVTRMKAIVHCDIELMSMGSMLERQGQRELAQQTLRFLQRMCHVHRPNGNA